MASSSLARCLAKSVLPFLRVAHCSALNVSLPSVWTRLTSFCQPAPSGTPRFACASLLEVYCDRLGPQNPSSHRSLVCSVIVLLTLKARVLPLDHWIRRMSLAVAQLLPRSSNPEIRVVINAFGYYLCYIYHWFSGI